MANEKKKRLTALMEFANALRGFIGLDPLRQGGPKPGKKKIQEHPKDETAPSK